MRIDGRLRWITVLLARIFCRPLTIVGRECADIAGPIVFVANHSSHADTATLIAALPRKQRRKLAPAAAEDYFFRTRVKGWIVRLLTGAFPFPRHGHTGIDRAAELLQQGRSVLLFPEGTRSQGGTIGEFHCGVGILAERGATVVPVGLTGTAGVLPKKSRFPRRVPVGVAFGEPRIYEGQDAKAIAADLRNQVCYLVEQADDVSLDRTPVLERMAAFAQSSRARWLGFFWGVVEAIFWPIIPEFYVAPLAFAAPGSFLPVAAATAAGSAVGGAGAYLVGQTELGSWLSQHLPFVTERMHEQALLWMVTEGPRGLLHQPMSGVPFKAFGLQAAGAGVSLPSFVVVDAGARALRIAAVAAIFAGGGIAFRESVRRVFGWFLTLYFAIFALALRATILSWS